MLCSHKYPVLDTVKIISNNYEIDSILLHFNHMANSFVEYCLCARWRIGSAPAPSAEGRLIDFPV